MKIAIISTIRDIWGGSEELWADMARDFLDTENNKILHLAYENKQIHPKLAVLNSKGLISCSRPGYIKPNSSEISKLLQISINYIRKKIIDPLKNVKKFNPDVVIYNGTCYSIAKEKELLKYMIQTPKIKFFIIGQLNADNIREINDNDALIVKKAYSICKKVFFVSINNKETAERHLCTNINNAFILKNPVNLNKVGYVKYPENNQMLFAMVGNLNTKHKGQDIVLSILAAPNWRIKNWRLRIYGSGPDENYLKDLIHHYNLADKIFLCGSVTNINELWAQNQILLMPSHMEGMALAIVEAMICGRPVVASDVGGSKEWIDDKKNGFIAESASKNAFEKAMLEACSNHSSWKEIGEAAHLKAIELYDPNPGKTLLKHLN